MDNLFEVMDKEEILSNLKKGRDKFKRRFIDNQDENGVLRENIGLDNVLKRDSAQYMRLMGTEKSFFVEPSFCQLHKKNSKGIYKRETEGTLILTSRRLTFCQLSKRGEAIDQLDAGLKYYVGSIGGALGGGYAMNAFRKKEDWILFSYPSYLLLGNLIKNSDKQISRKKGFVSKELELNDEEIKFVFEVEIDKSIDDQKKDTKKGVQLYQIDKANELFSLKLEHYMTFMKFFYKDSELYPSWDYERDENNQPLKKNLLPVKERNKLKKKLELENEKYIFKYQGKNWLGKVKKGLNNSENQLETKTLEPEVTQNFKKEIEVKNIQPKESNFDISSISEELEKLAALKDKGILTDEEFSAAKSRILNS